MKVLASVGVILFLLSGIATAAEEAVFPSQYLQWQEYFSGHWTGEGNIGDDAVMIECRARWAPGKHCLVFEGTTRWQGESGKAVSWTLLSGCDVESKEMVDTEFASDGFFCVTRWTILSPTEQYGRTSGVDGGKRFTGEAKVVKLGPDAWTFSTALPNGKSVKIEYKRAEEAKK